MRPFVVHVVNMLINFASDIGRNMLCACALVRGLRQHRHNDDIIGAAIVNPNNSAVSHAPVRACWKRRSCARTHARVCA